TDVERVADEIGIMRQGTLKISESLDSLKESVKKVRFFNFRNGTENFEISNAYYFERGIDQALATMRIQDESSLHQISKASGCQFEIMHLNLEDIFVDIVREPGSKQ
ncbi:MAG: type transport system ATP-binding protein, partial [Verrucomicrobiales bacterium]|nr:type transport system ATP-binding protein [Verrucomicrobiales bacterium]